MSSDLHGSTPPACEDPARELLDFYLNGTLEGDEAAAVRAHLEECAACAADFQDFSQLAAAVGRHGATIDAGWIRSPALRRLGVAAALVVTLSAALYVTVLNRPRVRVAPAHGPVEVQLDLGAGAMRDSQAPPVATLGPETRTIRVTLFPPVQPGARYLVGVRSVGGGVIIPEVPLTGLDATGRAAFVFPTAGLVDSGSYEVTVRGEIPDGEGLSFTYPFAVRGPIAEK